MHTIRTTRSRLYWLAGVLFVGLLLAGCGNQPSSANNAATIQSATPTRQPTPRPTAAQSTEEATPKPASPIATQATAASEPTTPPLPQATATVEVNWLKVSGKTEEGLAYLGNPDAPITLIDYADFM